MTITKVPLSKAAMRKEPPPVEADEPLVDTTAALPLRSKRLERLQKKRHQKEAASKQHATFWDLPSELILDILSHLRPSDIFNLSRVHSGFQTFILKDASRIANSIITFRYSILTKCFPLPILLENVDKEAHSALLDEERQAKHLHIHKKPYQHVQTPDPRRICTCLTCMLAWNNLCLLVDFARWQKNLEQGEPIPIIPRGKNPKWNQKLVAANAAVVQNALYNRLWYARILEDHLKSTVGSIRRHGNNAGNKRQRFRMTIDDVALGDDAFLSRSGPPSMEFPWHRDSYYMLESYLPNRGWNSEINGWVYMPSTQHDRDVEFVRAWAKRRNDTTAAIAESRNEMKELAERSS